MRIANHLSERERGIKESAISEIMAMKKKDFISLGPGEPDFCAPKPVIDYAKKMMSESSHYSPPQGLLSLRKAIASKLRRENGIKTGAENIVVTGGSMKGLLLSLLVLVDKGEKVLLPDPGFLGYAPDVRLIDAKPVYYDVKEDNLFEPDPDDIRRKAKGAELIILNSPSNPTGNVMSKSVLREIGEIARDNDMLIFSDEAYEKLVYGKKHYSIASLGYGDITLTFQTFSKGYAMCGFRIGYMDVPDELVHDMVKTHLFTDISAPTVSQHAAEKALKVGNKFITNMRKEYDKRRKYIVNKLNDIGLKTPEPNGAFYTFSNIKKFRMSSRKFAKIMVEKANVGVVPGSDFGLNGEGYIRCSYATSLSNIKAALERMEDVLKGF